MANRPIFKLHIPILRDIKSKGFKNAMVEKTDDIVTRITAGMNVGDIRSALRGDPAPRPNPRVKPHADGFWLHMRPTYFHNRVMNLYPTFRLGWMSVFFFLFEIITGLLLMVFYTPYTGAAYEDMLKIMSNVPLGQFLRDLHKIGAEGMVLVVCLHMLRTYITGSYKKPRQFTWLTGVVLLMVTLFLSFSGYLLPWDQLSLWAVTIGASMAEAVPPQIIGDNLNLLVRGAPQFSQNGLLRFYLIHVFAFPLIGIVFTGVHYYKVILHGHSLPPEAEEIGEDTARRVPVDQRSYFLPEIATRELFLAILLTVAMTFAVTVGNLFHAPLEPHADPLVTPLHTTAPWYFLWLQGMLKLGDKVLWGIVMPGIVFTGLGVLPYVEVGPSRRYLDRRVGLAVCTLVCALRSALTYMGTPFYGVETSAPQEVVATIIPQTHPGEMRLYGYEALPVGEWNTSTAGMIVLEKLVEENATENPEYAKFVEIMEKYKDEIAHFESLDGKVGTIIIDEYQPDLKRVRFIIHDQVATTEDFATPEAQAALYYIQTAFLHKDSNYDGN